MRRDIEFDVDGVVLSALDQSHAAAMCVAQDDVLTPTEHSRLSPARIPFPTPNHKRSTMPLIDVIYPEGALDAAAQEQLLAELWTSALHWEAIEATDAARSIAWVYLDERPAHHVSVAGRPATQPVYRINVHVMAGFMDQSRIDGMARELTDLVLAADGTDGDGSGPRVFCIVDEVPSGTWAVDGAVWTTPFTARALGLDDERVAAMERAVAGRPRLDVPLEPAV
jgi:phenylpyruvate tautomerase PptA (4-oxalocrotonate tautomerase family)